MKKLLLIIAFVLLLGKAVFANKVIVFNFGESDLNSDFNAASPELRKEQYETYSSWLAKVKNTYKDFTFMNSDEHIAFCQSTGQNLPIDIYLDFATPVTMLDTHTDLYQFYVSKLTGATSNPNTLYIQAAGNDKQELNWFGKPVFKDDQPKTFNSISLKKKIARGKLNIENKTFTCPDNLIIVGGLFHDQIASWANYGADITVYADQGYDVQSHGTCDAAYLVCNKVLEYLVSHPESTAAQLKQQIISQADLTTKFLPYTNIYR